MIIKYQAVIDPEFTGANYEKDWAKYNKIETHTMEDNIEAVRKLVLANKPTDAKEVIFYSVEDSKGLRFLREQIFEDELGRFTETFCISDFRFEWK